MKTTTDNNFGIRWNFTTTLEDLDNTDDIALLLNRYCFDTTCRSIGLTQNKNKSHEDEKHK
jgi:hypothetical protein